MAVPAQRILRYLLTHDPSSGTEDSHFIDLAKDLSAVNRRLYRQGKVYGVLGITVHDSSDNAFVKVCTAPNTWVVRNAWKKAFGLFKRMRKEALRSAGVGSNATATWADFKTYLTYPSISDPDWGVPVDCGNNAVSYGEWIYSTFHSPDGTTSDDEFLTHLLGNNVGPAGNYTSCGLVEGYQNSRARVQPVDPSIDPTEFEDSWMMNLFDDGTTHDEILEDLTSDGDGPPYDHNDMPGSAGNMVSSLVAGETHVAVGNPIGYIGSFAVPCGLLEVETTSTANPNTIELLIEIAPGGYKGVDAVAV